MTHGLDQQTFQHLHIIQKSKTHDNCLRVLSLKFIILEFRPRYSQRAALKFTPRKTAACISCTSISWFTKFSSVTQGPDTIDDRRLADITAVFISSRSSFPDVSPNASSISSRVFPLVSGTKRTAQTPARKQKLAKKM